MPTITPSMPSLLKQAFAATSLASGSILLQETNKNAGTCTPNSPSPSSCLIVASYHIFCSFLAYSILSNHTHPHTHSLTHARSSTLHTYTYTYTYQTFDQSPLPVSRSNVWICLLDTPPCSSYTDTFLTLRRLHSLYIPS
jgi:hypothetical protein